MKKLSVFFVCLVSVLALKAQDKIITVESDTINYKLQYDPASTFEETKHSWLVSINYGISHLPWLPDNVDLGKVPDNYTKIKTGFHLDANLHHMISTSLGVGLQYSFYKSDSPTTFDPHRNMSQKHQQYINYIGNSFILRQYLDKKHKIRISETLSGGIAFFRSKQQSFTDPKSFYAGYSKITQSSLVTGHAFAGKIGLSTEYKILPYLSIGLGGSLLLNWLDTIDEESENSNGTKNIIRRQKLEKSINLSRIDGSLLLHFHF